MKKLNKLFRVLIIAVILIIPSMYLLVGCDDGADKGTENDKADIETSIEYGIYNYKAQMVLNILTNKKTYDYSMSVENVDYVQLNKDSTIEIYNYNGGTGDSLVTYDYTISENCELFVNYDEKTFEKAGYIEDSYLYILTRIDQNQEYYIVYELQSDEQSSLISIKVGSYYSIGKIVKNTQQNSLSFTYEYDESNYLTVSENTIILHNGSNNLDNIMNYEIVGNRDIIIIGEDSAQTYVAGYVKGSQIYFMTRVLDVNIYEYAVYQFPINN